MEVLVLDSMTKTPIMAAIDDQKTGLKEKFTKWGSAEDAFKFWAHRTRLFIDQIRKTKEIFLHESIQGINRIVSQGGHAGLIEEGKSSPDNPEKFIPS